MELFDDAFCCFNKVLEIDKENNDAKLAKEKLTNELGHYEQNLYNKFLFTYYFTCINYYIWNLIF